MDHQVRSSGTRPDLLCKDSHRFLELTMMTPSHLLSGLILCGPFFILLLPMDGSVARIMSPVCSFTVTLTMSYTCDNLWDLIMDLEDQSICSIASMVSSNHLGYSISTWTRNSIWLASQPPSLTRPYMSTPYYLIILSLQSMLTMFSALPIPPMNSAYSIVRFTFSSR